jgi:hypothetical protein
MQTSREVEVSVNLVDHRRRLAEADCREAGRRCTVVLSAATAMILPSLMILCRP